MFDGEAFGQEMVAIVRDYMNAELEPLRLENAALVKRIEELESRELELPPAAELPDFEPLIADAVRKALDEMPVPADGKDGKDGAPGTDGERGERGEPGADGKDGVDGKDGADGIGLADALIDRDGNLVLTMTDGRTKSIGAVRGADGRDGRDGETFTIDDFDIVPMDNERSFKFCFTRGDVMHSFEFSFPVPIYRGVWQEREYQAGDMVTWGGSLYHCDHDTKDKPGSKSWTLATKKGRDGRDAPK